MDINKIYEKNTIADIIEDKEKLTNNVEILYHNFLKRIFKRGLLQNMEDMHWEIGIWLDSMEDAMEETIEELDEIWDLNAETRECILQNMIQKQKEKQRNWQKFTDCDKLFIIIKEAAKKFPNLFYLFGNSFYRPSDVINTLELKYSYVDFNNASSLLAPVIIYIDTEDLDDYLTKEKNKLYLNIFKGDDNERIKIRNFICDELEKTGDFIINRNAKEPGTLDRIAISNFKWKFRFWDNFFDKGLLKDDLGF